MDQEIIYFDVFQQLYQMTKWLEEKQPFCHLRFNDGEANGMFRLVPETATTSGEHRHMRDLGDALLRTLNGIIDFAKEKRGSDVRMLIGSDWIRDSSNNALRVLRNYLIERGAVKDISWANSDLWYSTVFEAQNICALFELIALCDELRTNNHNVILVGKKLIEKARYLIGARMLLIPEVDCWNDRVRIFNMCQEFAKEKATFVWCAGLPGKVWGWSIWSQHPDTTHIDAGHLFDGVFGFRNRMWLGRESGEHYRKYEEFFAPYLRSFIPVEGSC